MIDENDKQVLGLQLPTDPRWTDIAAKNLEDILVDHAYCEQKAASSCISLIVQYPENENLVEMLTPVVAEEWAHFERVIEELKKRGFKLGRQRKDEYVNRLPEIMEKGGSRKKQLVEKLLINALIEARSCERFRLLWKHLEDDDLKNFYYELMISEAGHYKDFIKLAKSINGDTEMIEKRWAEILKAESEIMQDLELRGDRMH